MITSQQEYEKLLYKIQDANAPQQVVLLPNDERIYNVDLNTRTIEAPEFLSVEHEHYAETIYFKLDRFYDSMDLSTTTCVIQYINGNGDSFLYPVPFYDVITETGKIIMPWTISGAATAFPGTVKFIIRFYKIDKDSITATYVDENDNYTLAGENAVFTYSISTLPAESKVLYGMSEENLSEEYAMAANVVLGIFQRIDEVAKDSVLYWIDADAI